MEYAEQLLDREPNCLLPEAAAKPKQITTNLTPMDKAASKYDYKVNIK
jgi:hypothetical protein